MQLVDDSFEWFTRPDGEALLREIEFAGRTCYKSEDKISGIETTKEFVRKMIKSGHHAMIEFAVPPLVKVITNRGVTHEIVRHRLFSFAQESTRYCDYTAGKFGGEMTYIKPVWWDEAKEEPKVTFMRSIAMAADEYQGLRKLGWSPQQAREVLPNALKTEINIKGNVREWRHFFMLRCSPKAHPQMQHIAIKMLKEFKHFIPVIFEDIYPEIV